MYKVSLTVITVLVLFLYLDAVFLGSIEQKNIIARLIIILNLSAGLYCLYLINVKFQGGITCKNKIIHWKRLKNKFLMFVIVWIVSLLYSFSMSYFLNQYFYFYYYIDCLIFSPIILIVFAIWVYIVDVKSEEPEDEYASFLKDFRDLGFSFFWKKYKVFNLGLLVKIFYVPYMYGATYHIIYKILTDGNNLSTPTEVVAYMFLIGVAFDVSIGLGGYLFSSKLLRTNNISVDDSWKGWIVCLICYPPFLILTGYFLDQVDNYIWKDWLDPSHFLYWVWAFFICLTWIFYWFSTVSFGFNFSNLSWRGLVNTGLYRYVKHPAYLSKNIYWWLHTVPWFGVLGWDLLRNLLALSCISFIYYLRAKTEERHLNKFEEYVQYSKWIDENGLYARIKKIIKICFD